MTEREQPDNAAEATPEGQVPPGSGEDSGDEIPWVSVSGTGEAEITGPSHGAHPDRADFASSNDKSLDDDELDRG